jgi:hypothetical protein
LDFIEKVNIKDDLVLIQFKLVKRDSLKTQNTFSFINVPTLKLADINLATLFEIINKSKSNKQNKEFLPYNKSILTRIMFDQIKK